MDFEHPKFRDAIKTVLKAAESHKKPVGIGMYGDFTDPDAIKKFIDQGFRLMLAGGDEWLLADGCRRLSQAYGKAKGIF